MATSPIVTRGFIVDVAHVVTAGYLSGAANPTDSGTDTLTIVATGAQSVSDGRASGHAYDADNWTPRWTPVSDEGISVLRVTQKHRYAVSGKSLDELARERLNRLIEEEDNELLMLI